MSRSSGLSMVELILVIAVLCILLMQADLPGFKDSLDRKIVEGMMSDIVSAIAMARQFAVTENKMVTLCRSNDGLHCQGKWHQGIIIFTDQNADHILNDDDRLLFRLQPGNIDGILSFNSFRNRQYLQMTPQGFTNNQNGNFTYCPNDRNPRNTRQIIISLSGRTRYARDMDGDGVIENSQGKPVTCK